MAAIIAGELRGSDESADDSGGVVKLVSKPKVTRKKGLKTQS